MTHMDPSTLLPGDRVLARNAFGQENERRAITGVMDGQDFLVVWICDDAEWTRAHNEGRDPEGIPFPAEDVRPLVDAWRGFVSGR